jgi:hypothetical protein
MIVPKRRGYCFQRALQSEKAPARDLSSDKQVEKKGFLKGSRFG